MPFVPASPTLRRRGILRRQSEKIRCAGASAVWRGFHVHAIWWASTIGVRHARCYGDRMHTLEIPRRQWSDRLDEFTRVHHGWPVALDILGEAIGAQPQFRLLSLAGVTAEARGGGRISITVTLPSGGFLTHTIDAPVHVFIEESDGGDEAALQIEAADGTRAILQFRIGPPVHGLVRGRCGEW